MEQHQQRGDPESGVSGTASAEGEPREWSERGVGGGVGVAESEELTNSRRDLGTEVLQEEL